MKEIWKDIEGYEECYQVSNFGRVKSLNYSQTGKEKVLKTSNRGNGYIGVSLWKNRKQKTFDIHRLVGVAFIPNPENKPQINHIDGDKTNNVIYNLEWNTRIENMTHRRVVLGYRHSEKTKKKMSKGKIGNKNSIKPINQFTKNGEFIRSWSSAIEVERTLNINSGNISSCLKGNYKSTGGYIWRYL